MKHALWTIALVALSLALLLTSCGGGATPAAFTIDSSAADQNNATGQQPTVSQGGLPGTEEFGLSKKDLITSIEAVEANIAKCMQEAGFEYVAVDYKTSRRGMVADKSLPGFSEKQFANQYGFGIATLYTGQDPQRADVNTPAKIGLGAKNIQYFEHLSLADQVAYNHTLLGEHKDATFAVALEGEDFSRTGGCTRAAIEQVFSPEQMSRTYLNPQDALIEQDPRMIAALGEYADCMHAAGFDYNNPNDPEPDIKKRLDAITNGAPVESLSAAAQAALTQLQGEERAIAAADYTCRMKLVEPVEAQILREMYSGAQQ